MGRPSTSAMPTASATATLKVEMPLAEKGILALDEIVGGVVDARAGHQRKMPVSKKTVTGVLSSTAQIRAASDSGMTAMREAAAASAPYKTASS